MALRRMRKRLRRRAETRTATLAIVLSTNRSRGYWPQGNDVARGLIKYVLCSLKKECRLFIDIWRFFSGRER